jgi:hypothetical protein
VGQGYTLVSYQLQTAIQAPPHPSICTLGCSDCDKLVGGGGGGGAVNNRGE